MMTLAALLVLFLTATSSLAASLSPLVEDAPDLGAGDAATALATSRPAGGPAAAGTALPLLGETILTAVPFDRHPPAGRQGRPILVRQTGFGR